MTHAPRSRRWYRRSSTSPCRLSTALSTEVVKRRETNTGHDTQKNKRLKLSPCPTRVAWCGFHGHYILRVDDAHSKRSKDNRYSSTTLTCVVSPKQIMTQNRELFAFLSTYLLFSHDGCEASLLFILLRRSLRMAPPKGRDE